MSYTTSTINQTVVERAGGVFEKKKKKKTKKKRRLSIRSHKKTVFFFFKKIFPENPSPNRHEPGRFELTFLSRRFKIPNKQKRSHHTILTDDVQRDEYAPDRLRAHLALVNSRVSLLSPFDVQCPLVRVRLVVDGLKSLVAGVRVRADRQYVYVSVPYPRHLKSVKIFTFDII